MVRCPICKSGGFDQSKSLMTHVHTAHAGQSIFMCSDCNKTFSHSQSMNRHINNSEKCKSATKICSDQLKSGTARETTTQNTEASTIIRDVTTNDSEKKVDGDNKIGADRDDIADTTLNFDAPETATWGPNMKINFIEWGKQSLPILAKSTAVGITAEYEKVAERFESVWGDCDAFTETLDAWYDDLSISGIKPATTCIRLRCLHWIAKWRQAMSFIVDESAMEYLTDLLSRAQTISTVATTNLSILAISDPYELVMISNEVVACLQKAQLNELDPFISAYLRERSPHSLSDLIDFGKHLRCWIDLAIRFTNVPTRIQCTIELLSHSAPSPKDYVSRLILRGEEFVRVLNKDKVGKYYAPVEIMLCKTISCYLYFYISFCRPDQQSPLAFQSDQGHKWTRASRDLKAYLKKRGLDPDRLEPSGRIIHGSRHIGLATFALMCGFDSNKISDYTVLMRHSMATCERVYSPWLRIERARRALNIISTARGLELPEVTPQVQLLHLRRPADVVIDQISAMMRKEHARIYVPTGVQIYSKVDASTQTGGDDGLQPKPTDGKKKCEKCGGSLALHGPYAVARDLRYFGRLWAECSTCALQLNNKRKRIWFDGGYVPDGWDMSMVACPRNWKAICTYIEKSTGKPFMDGTKLGFKTTPDSGTRVVNNTVNGTADDDDDDYDDVDMK